MAFLAFLKQLIAWQNRAAKGECPRSYVVLWARMNLSRVLAPSAPSARMMAIYFKALRWAVGGVGPQKLALDLLEQWYRTNPPCRFAHVEVWRFAMELALRVADPTSLDQGSTELCGATGPVYSYLCNDPRGYARLATSLVSTAAGRFGACQLQATPWICARALPARTTSADYVVLTCVRSVVPATGMMETAVQSTQPVVLQTMFLRMGYGDVRVYMLNLQEQVTARRGLAFDDSVVQGFRRTMALVEQGVTVRPGTARRSFEGSHLQRMQRAQGQVMQAIQLLNGGHHVLVMAVHPDLAEHVVNLRPLTIRPGEEMALHWVVIEELTLVGLDIRVTMVTWGRKRQAIVTQSAFFHLYYGFIAARP